MPSKSDSCRLSSGLEKDSWFVGTYTIVSPYTGESAEFTLCSSEVQTVHDSHFKMHRSNELIETIIFACYENDELLHDVRLNELISAVQPNQAASLNCLVDHFNSLSMLYFKRHGPYDSSAAKSPAKQRTSTVDIEIARGSRAKSFTLVPGVSLRRVRHSRFLSHIVQLCYNRAVAEPSELNKQKPFSTQTYGETMFTFIEHMVKHLFFEPEVICDNQVGSSAIHTTIGRVDEFAGWRAKRMSPDDRFIDLGSGVGQVVLQLAASVAYERPVVGVERASVPQRYAEFMAREFVRWMRFFARGYSPFALVGDDFLEPAYADLIKRSTVVFANNFLFGPRVDLQLTQLFAELPEGARVVSSKRFCDEPTKITERTANDISAIMRVDTFDALVGAVSWTSTAFSFYLQTIDRTRLERYYFAQRHRANPDADDVELCSSSESHVQALNVASPNATVSSSRSNSIASYRAASARRRGNMALLNTQTRVTRLIADDDDLHVHVRPLSVAATAIDCASPPSSTSVSTPVSTPLVDAEKPTRAIDALRKRLKVHVNKHSPGSSSSSRHDSFAPGTLRSPIRKKRKQESDSDCGTSSVLELFHAQADALANGSSQSDSRSCDASPHSAANAYPSNIFNLREYNDSTRERIECSLMRLAEADCSPSTPAMSSSASSFVADTSTQSPPSASRSTSLSHSSTSGVFSAARPSNMDREDTEEVVGNCESELLSTMRRLTDQSTSSNSLIGLLRTHVGQQRAHNATVAKKADVVSRFITSRRSRLNTLLEDYEQIEVNDNTSRPGDDPAGRILEHYSLSVRRVKQQEQRRHDLRTGLFAVRNSLDVTRSILMPMQPTALSINANLSGCSSAYTNVSPAESEPSPTQTPPVADTRQPPITLSVSSPYPHYATLCQTAPLALGNRVAVGGVNVGGAGLLQAYAPAPATLMQPANLNMSSNLGVQFASAQFGGVDAAAQRFAVASPGGNAQLPPTAFFGMVPGAHAQHAHQNLNLPVYPTLYTNASHAL